MLLAFLWLIFKAMAANATENIDHVKTDEQKDLENPLQSNNSTTFVCTEPSSEDLELYDNLVYYVDGVAQVIIYLKKFIQNVK